MSILCVPACIPALPAFAMTSAPALLCPGDSISVDGSATVQGNGPFAQWTWLVNGQSPLITSGPIATVAFNSPGAHPLQLQVVDSAGCLSFLSEPIIVPVGGGADFSGTSVIGPACLPDTLELVGQAAMPVPSIASQTGWDFDTGMSLPDNVGWPFISQVEVDWFPTSAVVTDVSILGDICIDIEHSFMADLSIRLKCPNGQSVSLHAQGGGATFLGQPNQTDTIGDPIPYGECWTYCFSPQASLGTMASCAYIGATPNVTPFENYYSLLPGTYTPAQPFTNLIGCPLNGTWRFEVVDLWAADNGYLCGWSMGIAPGPDTLYSGVGPTLNLNHPDSAFWSGPWLLPTSFASQAWAAPPAPGPLAHTYTVIDSYGCASDTTINVNAYDAPTPPIAALNGSELTSSPASAYQWFLNGQAINGATAQTYWPTENGDYAVQAFDANGCDAMSNVIYFGSASVPLLGASRLRLYPQPATHELMVNGLARNASARILDGTGRVVWAGQLQAPLEVVPVGHLPTGIYTLVLGQVQGQALRFAKE